MRASARSSISIELSLPASPPSPFSAAGFSAGAWGPAAYSEHCPRPRASVRVRSGSRRSSPKPPSSSPVAATFDRLSPSAWEDSIFTRWLAGDIFPEARTLVRAHQKRGHTVAVVSSATRYQIEAIARDLGIKHILCTELAVRDDVAHRDAAFLLGL